MASEGTPVVDPESVRRPSAGDRRPIVVGYTDTAHAREALVWAAAEASRLDAPLLVVYAANYPGMTLGPGPGLLEPDPGALDAANEVTARGVAEAIAAQPGLRVSGATEVTSPAQTLIEAAAEAELVVIGTRGRAPVLGALLGSVAFAVAARASGPVVVVKTHSPLVELVETTTPRTPSGDIVVGTDGSESAADAVRFAADRAVQTSQALQVVTCTGEPPPAGISEDQLRDAAGQIADATLEMLARTSPQVKVAARVEDGPAERALIDASASADMVVVGTRGRGAFRAMLLGSVSHAVIHGARCPVAVV